MKASLLDHKAGPDALILGEIQRPRPQAGEVLVQVHATAVTPTDIERTGHVLPSSEGVMFYPLPFGTRSESTGRGVVC